MVKSKFMFDGYLEKIKKLINHLIKKVFSTGDIVSKYNKFV